jgi:S-adenosylmethionine:tRNA ribosyltransferase-isomerase
MEEGLAAWDFTLPPERIAQAPARPRDAARLMVVGAALEHARVRDLPRFLSAGDLLVVNDTRVIPAQLEGRRGAARVGITLDRPEADGTWMALARNARRLRAGDRLELGAGLGACVVAAPGDGTVRLRFDAAGEAFERALAAAGRLALPPYIARPAGPVAEDERDYQTIFARAAGAVAAPTAGLHFTPRLLAALEAAGVERVAVTLHVGAGTFLPMRTDPEQHRMHAERGWVSEAAAARITAARAAGRRVVAVGTTVLRLLETATDGTGQTRAFAGETSIFLRPGVAIRSADRLLTNFHLPRSTLFLLVCAFAGTERMRAAYAAAIEAGYRFYSYGDATLLERAG